MPSKKKVEPKKPEPKEEPLMEEEQESSAGGASESAGVKKGSRAAPELLRGFRDILPAEQVYWDMVRDASRAMAEAYSFERIDTPIVERSDVFMRTVGKQTDIIEKEMYAFEDLSGESVALRPEATASVARAYINHGMLNLPQPVKLWYQGQMFRHERPQAGRFREFYQTGFEVIGVQEAVVDAQLIVIAYKMLEELGIPVTVQINSIGNPGSRQAYLAELAGYLRPHRGILSEDDKRRLQKNPLRILDSKDPNLQEILAGAPHIVDWLDENSKAHFTKVLEFLEEAQIPYNMNPRLVRGLDYYTHTVFELVESGSEGESGQQHALGGGGRYDGLIELLGGRPTPACGFALGMDRITKILQTKNPQAANAKKPQVFFAQLGDAARRAGLKLFEAFRLAHIPVAEAFGKNALKAQLEAANKMGVRYTIILGQKEVLDGTIIVRDMESGAQEIVDSTKVVALLSKKMQK